jgi:Zn-dependent protease with chaperone function
MAVTAHELAHKKGHHVLYRMLVIVAVMIATILNWSRFTVPVIFNLAFSLLLFQILANTALLAFLMMVLVPVSWYMECKADVAAAKFVGKFWIRSVL